MPKEAPSATATDALVWAKEAMASSRSLVDPHVRKRMAQRAIEWRSIWYALKSAKICRPYVTDDGTHMGGTSWRIIGADHNGEEISIGVETFVEPLGGPVLLLTVF